MPLAQGLGTRRSFPACTNAGSSWAIPLRRVGMALVSSFSYSGSSCASMLYPYGTLHSTSIWPPNGECCCGLPRVSWPVSRLKLGIITMRNRISILALVLSIASLGYAGWLQYRMDTALERRERELVRRWAPQMRSIYADMMPGTNTMPADPQTLDELFSPLFRLVSQIGDGGETATPNGKAK